MSTASLHANFIIGGTEKAGTTSVFDWLAQHPATSASLRKETNFFHDGFCGTIDIDTARYARYFRRHAHAAIRFEASPVYLSQAAVVAPRVRQMLPDAKVLFILREPVARLHSFFEFYRSKLYLPANLTLEAYIGLCFEYGRGAQQRPACRIDPWFLTALQSGCYAGLIEKFEQELAPGHVKIAFYENLRADPLAFMIDLSQFLGIDAKFWRKFHFRRSNVTFYGRSQALHRLAVCANAALEPVLRSHPALKRSIVLGYKAINQAHEGYGRMPASTLQSLASFYAPSITALQRSHDLTLPLDWRMNTP
jgi:hypothetical protein